MTDAHRPARRAKTLVIAAAFGAPAVFLISLPWLKEQPDAVVYLFAGLAATVTVLASFALAIIKDRALDEWHRSATRFSSQWGWLTGGGVVALLLALPPFHDLIISLAARARAGGAPEEKIVLLAFTGGFMTLVLVQTLCTIALSIVWRAWMSRSNA